MIKIQDVLITSDLFPVECKYHVSWTVIFSIAGKELRFNKEKSFYQYIKARDLYRKKLRQERKR